MKCQHERAAIDMRETHTSDKWGVKAHWAVCKECGERYETANEHDARKAIRALGLRPESGVYYDVGDGSWERSSS